MFQHYLNYQLVSRLAISFARPRDLPVHNVQYKIPIIFEAQAVFYVIIIGLTAPEYHTTSTIYDKVAVISHHQFVLTIPRCELRTEF